MDIPDLGGPDRGLHAQALRRALSEQTGKALAVEQFFLASVVAVKRARRHAYVLDNLPQRRAAKTLSQKFRHRRHEDLLLRYRLNI